MQIDYYAVKRNGAARAEPDLEHELVRTDAVARGKIGDVVLLKVWLRTDGRAELERVEQVIADAVRPLGLR